MDLVRPAAEFVDVVASPTFGDRPAGRRRDRPGLHAGARLRRRAAATSRPAASAEHAHADGQPAYWAGPPAIGDDHARHRHRRGAARSRCSRPASLDYAPIGDRRRDLDRLRRGPSARSSARSRRCRPTTTASTRAGRRSTTSGCARRSRRPSTGGGSRAWRADEPPPVATSMVPPGIPGRSDRDVVPAHDPAAARERCSRRPAIPGGAGFPAITMLDRRRRRTTRRSSTSSSASSASRSRPRRWTSSDYFDRLDDRPAAASGRCRWVADYPGRNDFLGVLLGTRCRPTTTASWSSPEFDAAIADAGAATDAAAAGAAYDRAEDDRPARRPGHPGQLRHRLGAVARRAARRRPERAREPAPGGAGVGAVIGRRRGRVAGCAVAALAVGVARVPGLLGVSPARRGGPGVRHADDVTGRSATRHRLHASRSRSTRRSSASSCS